MQTCLPSVIAKDVNNQCVCETIDKTLAILFDCDDGE